MDLALALGMPVGVLSRLMTEREFARWIVYMRKRKLPQARIESYLAQISFYLVRVMGGNENVTLCDFLLDFTSKDTAKKKRRRAQPDDDEDDLSEDELDELKRDLGFKPLAGGSNGT